MSSHTHQNSREISQCNVPYGSRCTWIRFVALNRWEEVEGSKNLLRGVAALSVIVVDDPVFFFFIFFLCRQLFFRRKIKDENQSL